MAVCYFVGGPNGSGKSTIISEVLVSAWAGAVSHNADDISRAMRSQPWGVGPKWAYDYLSAQIVQNRVDACIRAKRDFVVETVLSSDKFFTRLLAAKRRGFSVEFVFVYLPSVAEAMDRIEVRVQQGLHSVPADKVARRWPRSLARAPYFFALADRAVVFDNSDHLSRPVVVKDDLGVRLAQDPHWVQGQRGEVQAMIADCLVRPASLERALADWRASGFAARPARNLLRSVQASLRR